MKRTVAISILLICVLGSVQAFAAEKVRLRWISSIYMDLEGEGLKNPEGVACNGKDIFVADTGNSRILHYTLEDESIKDKATFPISKSVPIVVQVNSKGFLYYLDGRERRIAVLDIEGDEEFIDPKGLPFSSEIVAKSFKIGSDDNLYVLDIFSENVVVLDSTGQYLRHLSFPENFGFISDITVDSNGTVFLLDGVEATIHTAASDAEEFSLLTESMKEYLNFPTSLATDEDGRIYVVDRHGSGVALVSPEGEFLGRKIGTGWTEGLLYYPSQICVTGKNVLIADRSNSRVQLFTLIVGK